MKIVRLIARLFGAAFLAFFALCIAGFGVVHLLDKTPELGALDLATATDESTELPAFITISGVPDPNSIVDVITSVNNREIEEPTAQMFTLIGNSQLVIFCHAPCESAYQAQQSTWTGRMTAGGRDFVGSEGSLILGYARDHLPAEHASNYRTLNTKYAQASEVSKSGWGWLVFAGFVGLIAVGGAGMSLSDLIKMFRNRKKPATALAGESLRHAVPTP